MPMSRLINLYARWLPLLALLPLMTIGAIGAYQSSVISTDVSRPLTPTIHVAAPVASPASHRRLAFDTRLLPYSTTVAWLYASDRQRCRGPPQG